jgi:mycofactocin precursor
MERTAVLESAAVDSPSPPQDVSAPPTEPAGSTTTLLAEEDLLVEDVSIDGMCGVY